MARTENYEKLLFLYKRKENMSVGTFGSHIDEYRSMDKETVFKMLLASQEENKKLHASLTNRMKKLVLVKSDFISVLMNSHQSICVLQKVRL